MPFFATPPSEQFRVNYSCYTGCTLLCGGSESLLTTLLFNFNMRKVTLLFTGIIS